MERSELDEIASAFEQEVDPGEWKTVSRPPIPQTGNTKLVSFRLSESLYREVARLAEEQGISFSDIVREALSGYVSAAGRDEVHEMSIEDLGRRLHELSDTIVSLALEAVPVSWTFSEPPVAAHAWCTAAFSPGHRTKRASSTFGSNALLTRRVLSEVH